jgi:hypothetical protein
VGHDDVGDGAWGLEVPQAARLKANPNAAGTAIILSIAVRGIIHIRRIGLISFECNRVLPQRAAAQVLRKNDILTGSLCREKLVAAFLVPRGLHDQLPCREGKSS